MHSSTPICSSYSERSVPSPSNFQSRSEAKAALHSFLHLLRSQYGFTAKDIIEEYQESDTNDIPVAVFSSSLSPAEALCKYLKENRSLRLHDIGELLHRDERGIWSTYHRVRQKMPEPFTLPASSIAIPLHVFSDRSLSILENVAHYLHQTLAMSVADMARLLNKRHSVIHTTLTRAKKKREIKNER